MNKREDRIFVLEGFQCSTGHRLVVKNLSFSLAPGESLVIQGPSGAGKSTLLKALKGLVPSQASWMHVDDMVSLQSSPCALGERSSAYARLSLILPCTQIPPT